MTEEALADLARLRDIAEQGRRLPLMGGRHLILWGGVVALASFLHFAVFAQILPWPAVSVAVIWFGLTGLAAIISRMPIIHGGAKRARTDVGNRVERAVWQAGGAFLGLSAIAIFAHGYLTLHQDHTALGFALFQMMPALTFGVYAIAMRVSAEIAELQEFKPFAWISLLMAALTIILAGSLWQFVATVIGVITVSIIPGLKLLRIEAGHHNGG